MVAQLRTVRTSESYHRNRGIVWYANHISIKLLFAKGPTIRLRAGAEFGGLGTDAGAGEALRPERQRRSSATRETRLRRKPLVSFISFNSTPRFLHIRPPPHQR